MRIDVIDGVAGRLDVQYLISVLSFGNGVALDIERRLRLVDDFSLVDVNADARTGVGLHLSRQTQCFGIVFRTVATARSNPIDRLGDDGAVANRHVRRSRRMDGGLRHADFHGGTANAPGMGFELHGVVGIDTERRVVTLKIVFVRQRNGRDVYVVERHVDLSVVGDFGNGSDALNHAAKSGHGVGVA